MRDIDVALRATMGLSDALDPRREALRRALAVREPELTLTWEIIWERQLATHRGFRLWIEPVPAEARRGGAKKALSDTHQLRILWPERGSRIIAHGPKEKLEEEALALLQAGGPHGGPAEEPRFNGRFPVLHFSTRDELGDGTEVASYGAGFQAWLRPLPSGERCVHLVSPSGSFVLVGFERPTNAALLADHQARTFDPWGDTIPSGYRPFLVRQRGVPLRLIHTPIPGVLGRCTTDLGELVAVLLGVDDIALLRATDEGDVEVLARGPRHEIVGLELLPAEPPRRDLTPPPMRYGEPTAASIEGMTSIAAPLRERFARALHDTSNEPGAQTCRAILWALCALHERGCRSDWRGTSKKLVETLNAERLLPNPPDERALRNAMKLLKAHVGFVVRVGNVWLVRFDWLATPPDELLQPPT